MYKTFEEAKNAAEKTVDRNYNGEKKNVVIVETKKSKNSKSCFNFRFYETETNGVFVRRNDGWFEKRTRI